MRKNDGITGSTRVLMHCIGERALADVS